MLFRPISSGVRTQREIAFKPKSAPKFLLPIGAHRQLVGLKTAPVLPKQHVRDGKALLVPQGVEEKKPDSAYNEDFVFYDDGDDFTKDPEVAEPEKRDFNDDDQVEEVGFDRQVFFR